MTAGELDELRTCSNDRYAERCRIMEQRHCLHDMYRRPWHGEWLNSSQARAIVLRLWRRNNKCQWNAYGGSCGYALNTRSTTRGNYSHTGTTRDILAEVHGARARRFAVGVVEEGVVAPMEVNDLWEQPFGQPY